MNSLSSCEATRSEVWFCEYKYNLIVGISEVQKFVSLLDLEKATLHHYGTAKCRAYFRLRHKKTGKSCDSYTFF